MLQSVSPSKNYLWGHAFTELAAEVLFPVGLPVPWLSFPCLKLGTISASTDLSVGTVFAALEQFLTRLGSWIKDGSLYDEICRRHLPKPRLRSDYDWHGVRRRRRNASHSSPREIHHRSRRGQLHGLRYAPSLRRARDS